MAKADKPAGLLLPPFSEALHVVDGSRMLLDPGIQLAGSHFGKVSHAGVSVLVSISLAESSPFLAALPPADQLDPPRYLHKLAQR